MSSKSYKSRTKNALTKIALSLISMAYMGFAQADVPSDMKSLVEQGRFVEAFELGMKNERLTGEPVYDYYFGIAAIDSGRASLGVLALERVLLTNPGNDLARLELARGYFVIGDFERSKEEFQKMAAKQVPPSVRNSIEKYLAQIKAEDPQFRTTWRTYTEFALGHNSNVNSSTNQLVPCPAFYCGNNSQLLIDPGSSKSSSFNQLALGTSVSGPIVPGIKYLLGFDASVRQHAQIDNFDQRNVSLNGGAEFIADTSRYRVIGFFNQASLDDKKLRDVAGGIVDWVKPMSQTTTLRSSVGFATLRYTGENALIRDADMPSFSVGGNYYIGGDWKAAIDVDFNLAREKNIRGNSDLTRDIYGARTLLALTPFARMQINIGFGYAKSKYEGAEPFAPSPGVIKDDDLFTSELAAQYQLTKGWSIRTEWLRAENRSNVELYRYKQDVVLMKMRYEWK